MNTARAGRASRPPGLPQRDGTALVVAVAVALLWASPAAAQTLQGRVIEAGSEAPVAGAVVRLLGAESEARASTTTDAEGRFAVTTDAAGEYRIGVQSIGYAAASLGPVVLAATAPTTVVIRLAADAVPLDALRVETEARVLALERAGFYDRRRFGHGRFFERSDIEQHGSRRVVDMLRGVSGVRVVESGSVADIVLRAGGVMSMRTQGGSSMCAPEIYLDGRIVSRGGELGRDRHNLNEIRPTELEAIEVYASAAQVPARFGGAHAACGVVLLWSRQ